MRVIADCQRACGVAVRAGAAEGMAVIGTDRPSAVRVSGNFVCGQRLAVCAACRACARCAHDEAIDQVRRAVGAVTQRPAAWNLTARPHDNAADREGAAWPCRHARKLRTVTDESGRGHGALHGHGWRRVACCGALGVERGIAHNQAAVVALLKHGDLAQRRVVFLDLERSGVLLRADLKRQVPPGVNRGCQRRVIVAQTGRAGRAELDNVAIVGGKQLLGFDRL